MPVMGVISPAATLEQVTGFIAIRDDKRHAALPQTPRERCSGEALADDEDAG
jgi:hypothetical protein